MGIKYSRDSQHAEPVKIIEPILLFSSLETRVCSFLIACFNSLGRFASGGPDWHVFLSGAGLFVHIQYKGSMMTSQPRRIL